MREADVVISHAGAGTAIAALELGKCPLIAPAGWPWGEQIDDHQIQIARELDDRGLAISVEADQLSYEDSSCGAKGAVTTRLQTPCFAMSGDGAAGCSESLGRKQCVECRGGALRVEVG